MLNEQPRGFAPGEASLARRVSYYVIGTLFALIIALDFVSHAFDFASPHLMHTLIHEVTSAIILATIVTQLFAPRRFVAGAQTLLAVFVLAWLMDALTLRFSGLGMIMLGGVVLAVLHPVRGEIFALRSGVNVPLLALALMGALAFLPYALTQAAYQRSDVAPVHAELGHREWAATIALLHPLLAAIAALRVRGSLLPAWLAGLGLMIFGTGSIVLPGEASSLGVLYGAIIIVGGIVAIGLAQWDILRQAERGQSTPSLSSAH
jgi:hypothetical protein